MNQNEDEIMDQTNHMDNIIEDSVPIVENIETQPFLIDMILEVLMTHMRKQDLLNARLVHSLWNEKATNELLKFKKAVKIPDYDSHCLTSLQVFKKYRLMLYRTKTKQLYSRIIIEDSSMLKLILVWLSNHMNNKNNPLVLKHLSIGKKDKYLEEKPDEIITFNDFKFYHYMLSLVSANLKSLDFVEFHYRQDIYQDDYWYKYNVKFPKLEEFKISPVVHYNPPPIYKASRLPTILMSILFTTAPLLTKLELNIVNNDHLVFEDYYDNIKIITKQLKTLILSSCTLEGSIPTTLLKLAEKDDLKLDNLSIKINDKTLYDEDQYENNILYMNIVNEMIGKLLVLKHFIATQEDSLENLNYSIKIHHINTKDSISSEDISDEEDNNFRLRQQDRQLLPRLKNLVILKLEHFVMFHFDRIEYEVLFPEMKQLYYDSNSPVFEENYNDLAINSFIPLKKLILCNIDCCKFIGLVFPNLESLEILNVGQNQMEQLIYEFGYLRKLKILKLHSKLDIVEQWNFSYFYWLTELRKLTIKRMDLADGDVLVVDFTRLMFMRKLQIFELDSFEIPVEMENMLEDLFKYNFIYNK